MKKPTPKQLEKFVNPFCKTLDPMHNFNHIRRIKRKVAFLKKQYKDLDEDFLNFLIYFHSSRKWARKNKARIMRLGYPASWIYKINKPITKEGKIVWDANCLENVGRFGIKKTLTLEKYYKQIRKQTLELAKNFSKKYKFYTPLGKKLGNPGIKIKREWMNKEFEKLEKMKICPKNQQYFKKLIPFAKKILILCEKNKIPTIIYGSYAHFYHTKDNGMKVNDIDVIIPKKDFPKILKLLEKEKIKSKYLPFIYRNEMSTIIIKKGKLKVEVDEVGTGYKLLNEKNFIKSTNKIDFYGVNVRMITLEQLEDVYLVAYNRTKDNKAKLLKRIKHLEKFLGRKIR